MSKLTVDAGVDDSIVGEIETGGFIEGTYRQGEPPVQNKWQVPPKVAEESNRTRLSGFTKNGKISIKDLQAIYDQVYESKLIPTPVPVAKLMDDTVTDEVFKEKNNPSSKE